MPDGDSYADPYLTADHQWLHLEARYNYENLHTGSLWAGYNFTAGKTLQLAVTPMIGGVFGARRNRARVRVFADVQEATVFKLQRIRV